MTYRPEIMRDYGKGKIYKIVCYTTGKIYVGSTTKHYLSQRLSSHCEAYRKHLQGYGSRLTSFEILAELNFSIVLLENCPCTSKDELLARERHYIEKLDCLNKCVPTRTKQEYKRDKCALTRKQNQAYLAKPENKLKQRLANPRHAQTDKAKATRAYRDKMKREWGDRYCNMMLHICWDVFG